MTAYALRLENSTDTAVRARFADLLGLVSGSAALTSRSGLRRDGGGVVAVQVGAMNVTVTPFMGWVQGGVSVAQAGYPFVLDATLTLAVAPGHASLARIDTIAARVRDNAYDGSGAIVADVLVVQGTPASSPVAPALPTNSIPLRDLNVPAGLSAGTGGLQNSHLSTDRRKYIAGTGGVLYVAGATERDALGALEGQMVYRADVDRVEQFNGSAWAPITPNDVGAWRFPATSYTWTNQTAYAVVPDATERTALTTTLVKTSAATRLMVSVAGCVAHSSGAAQTWYLGLRIGGTDYDVSQAAIAAAGPGVRTTFADHRIITGAPAGSLTIEPVFKSSTTSTAAVFGPSAGDRITYTVREIP